MNRCLPRCLSFSLIAATTCFVSWSAPSFAAVQQDADQEEKEYIESKYFPKKGKYLDWIEANKLSNQGVRFAREGRYKSAVAMFQQAIQRYSHDYTYYENLGAALHKSGNLERAESTTELATQMAPRRWGPWYNLGLILTKEHEYKRALTALRRAKSLKAPQSKTAGINRLIAALERKLEDGPAAATTAAVTPTEASDAASSLPGAGQSPSTVSDSATSPSPSSASSPSYTSGPDNSSSKNSASNPNSASSSNSNPYTTVPDVSPIPTVPANINEKGK